MEEEEEEEPLMLLLLSLVVVVGVVGSSSTASWRRAVDCGPSFSVPPKLTFLFFFVWGGDVGSV